MQECGHAVVLQLIGAGEGDLGEVEEMGAIPGLNMGQGHVLGIF